MSFFKCATLKGDFATLCATLSAIVKPLYINGLQYMQYYI